MSTRAAAPGDIMEQVLLECQKFYREDHAHVKAGDTAVVE